MVTFNAAISASARCWRMALHFLARADVAALPTGAVVLLKGRSCCNWKIAVEQTDTSLSLRAFGGDGVYQLYV